MSLQKNMKPSLNEWKNFWYTLHSSKVLFFNILDSVSHAYTLLCRGGSKNEKCPVASEDLVLLYNAAQEGLYVLFKMIGVHLTCLLYVRAQKMVLSNFVKLTSNAFALTCMLRRVIRADAAEGDTYINVGGFLSEWTTGKKICGQ
jgi:hypothetical protein